MLNLSRDYCYISISIYIYFACLFVVSNKRQNGWTDRAQILCGTSRDPREGLWMIKFSKICLYQNSIFENFENLRIFFIKSTTFFFKSPAFFCFCFTMYTKRTCLQWECKMDAKRPNSPIYLQIKITDISLVDQTTVSSVLWWIQSL